MINKFFLPSVRHPATGAASGFSVQGEAAGEAIPDVFSCQLLLPRQGRICRKSTSKRREQARQPTFAP